jgi:hypothetical protein
MTYQFKIQLKDISNPRVWRRVLVPSNFTFEEFHRVIQFSFGWEFSHLFFFSPTGYRSKPMIEMNTEEDEFYEVLDEDSLDAETTLLSEIFISEKQKFTYLYDFGDDWKHQITLEKILVDDEIEKPVMLKGEGACPPEDCGGPWRYMDLKETLADKKHPEYKEMRAWLGLRPGENWNADAFNLEEYQQILNLYF